MYYKQMWWETCASGISCVCWSWRKRCFPWIHCLTLLKTWIVLTSYSGSSIAFVSVAQQLRKAVFLVLKRLMVQCNWLILRVPVSPSKIQGGSIKMPWKEAWYIFLSCHLWYGFLDLCTPFWRWKQQFFPQLYLLNFKVNTKEMLG